MAGATGATGAGASGERHGESLGKGWKKGDAGMLLRQKTSYIYMYILSFSICLYCLYIVISCYIFFLIFAPRSKPNTLDLSP